MSHVLRSDNNKTPFPPAGCVLREQEEDSTRWASHYPTQPMTAVGLKGRVPAWGAALRAVNGTVHEPSYVARRREHGVIRYACT